MTIVNIFCGHDRALVAVDTIATNGSERFEAGKFAVLPQFCGVLTVRGFCMTLFTVYGKLFQIPTFDEAANGLLDHVRTAYMGCRHLMPRVPHAPDVELIDGDEVNLVGYSPSRGCMVVAAVTRRGTEFTQDETINDWSYSPGLNDSGELPPDMLNFDPDTPEKMRWLMHRQLESIERDTPTERSMYGGSLVCAEVTKRAVNVMQLGPL